LGELEEVFTGLPGRGITLDESVLLPRVLFLRGSKEEMGTTLKFEIEKLEDRKTIANILLENGYTVGYGQEEGIGLVAILSESRDSRYRVERGLREGVES